MCKKSGAEGTTSSGQGSQQTPEERFHRLTELSPSAKFVYTVLRDDGALTQDTIADRTLLPKRTVRYALGKLEHADLIEEQPSVRDARTQYYSAKSVERAGED